MLRKGPSGCAKMVYKCSKLVLLVLLLPNYLTFLKLLFGVAEAEDEVPDIQPTPAKAEEVLPPSAFVPKAADTLGQPSTSGLKREAKTDTSDASKRKSAKPSKLGPVALADATHFYPTAKEKATYLHIGVDPHYIGQHEGSQFTKLVSTRVFMLVIVVRGVKTLLNVMFSLKIKHKCPLTLVSSILEYV